MINFDDIFMTAAKQREEDKENFVKESKENREKCLSNGRRYGKGNSNQWKDVSIIS